MNNKLIVFFVSLVLIIIGFSIIYYTSVRDTSNISKTSLHNVETNIPLENPSEEISSFSTKIYNTEPNRQNNIQITCETLTPTIIKSGATFSFSQTIRSCYQR